MNKQRDERIAIHLRAAVYFQARATLNGANAIKTYCKGQRIRATTTKARIATTDTTMSGGPKKPERAAAAPTAPPQRAPTTTEKFTMFGPGRNCESAKVS